MTIDAFAQHFADIKDPRQTAKVSYPLYDVLFLSICAIILNSAVAAKSTISSN